MSELARQLAPVRFDPVHLPAAGRRPLYADALPPRPMRSTDQRAFRIVRELLRFALVIAVVAAVSVALWSL